MLNLRMADGSADRPKRVAHTRVPAGVEPVAVLLLVRGKVSARSLSALHNDERLELIVTDHLNPNSLGLAQRVSAVLVATDGDPLAGLGYALTAGLTVPIVLVLQPEFRKECRDLLLAGAAGCITMPIKRGDVDKLMKSLATHAGDTRVDRTLRLLLDPIGRIVRYHDRSEKLSQREFAVLHCLSARSGQPVAADALLRYVWGDRQSGKESRQILEVYIFQLRRKLERLGLKGAIATVRGFGYSLVPVLSG